MKSKHFVILVPGLGDKTNGLKIVTKHWTKYGLSPVIFSIGWRDGKNFRPKLNKLVDLIDQYSEGNNVSLVGTSAGGSAALNAFVERKNKIHRVINICGRLKVGPLYGFRSFSSKTISSPSFAESVKLFESNEKSLSISDRKKIMTVRPMFGDELVPPSTVSIDGAYNIIIPTSEHLISIAMSLTLFSRKLLQFLNSSS